MVKNQESMQKLEEPEHESDVLWYGMVFSPEEMADFKRIAARVRSGAQQSIEFPAWKRDICQGRPHVEERLNQVLAMSDRELLDETIADCIIYGDSTRNAERDFYQNTDEPSNQRFCEFYYKHIRGRLDAIAQGYIFLDYVPSENTVLWKRLAMLTALSEKQLMDHIEADVYVFDEFLQ